MKIKSFLLSVFLFSILSIYSCNQEEDLMEASVAKSSIQSTKKKGGGNGGVRKIKYVYMCKYKGCNTTYVMYEKMVPPSIECSRATENAGPSRPHQWRYWRTIIEVY